MTADIVPGADGVQLAREQRGSAPRYLLLVHGWCCNSQFWAPQAEALADTCTTVTVDLGGHGNSRNTRQRWDLSSFAEDVAAAAQGLDGPIVLAGHSMGGAVAMLAASKLGERLRGVILGDTFSFDWGHVAEDLQTGYLAAIDSDLPAMVANLVDGVAPADPDPLLQQWLKREMARPDPQVAVPAFASLLNFDADAALAALPGTLPIHAINCPQAHPAPRERYADRISESVLDDTGHFLQLEKPAEFAAAMREQSVRMFVGG
ncbi:alpha/beta fold hydrolase [Solimonas terrae]|uniref:Alpha/beta hydrolase n=1 Tax=Solimonas terrae TaxID=1396819 RepID=A0A6M2BUY6_9GAMM|nr:alpha/beta hydrolase [Solimonas terrae]NGY06204.1 alpha/beta hydrolase [Solimonas terrae]